MAFHPYPQVIPRLFNVNGFGPPLCVTTASACPWVDHTVSRLPLLTNNALFRLAFASAPPLNGLTWPATATRRLIMQKARRHHAKRVTPTACKRMVSGSVSLPCSGFFSPFPHGTGSLSVSQEYLALTDGPAGFTQGFTCPALLRIPLSLTLLTHTGLSPSLAALSKAFWFVAQRMSRSYNPRHAETCLVWAAPISLATTLGITLVFSSSAYLDVSVRRVRLPQMRDDRPSTCRVAPFGHLRIIAHVQLPAAFRSLSRPSSPLGA